MKSINSILLLFLLSWQWIFKGGVFVWYWSNYSYIVTELCVNKEKPELHCNGQCILMQRLRATEQEERYAKELPLRVIEKLTLSQFISVSTYFMHIPMAIVQSLRFVAAPILVGSDHLQALFQPPE